ncbi:hypothetical protein AMATHDRAFT_44976 [Amanita thiersii Skay4041]|uniref:Fcf2 pre-rRNA processing C-terminal domain-containing protein n=1 Tax=Amanita thiersii Skay4041 TaxID=703135 RepID=A0A2A9P0A5_9AGAR|nr:hypothetical protein AMATHDRAFT_44976 [Amanita thiersii Skay4041]
MSPFAASTGKENERAVDPETSDSASESEYSTDSDSSSSTSSIEDEVTPEYLESLLNKARRNVALQSMDSGNDSTEDDVITLEKEQSALPLLDPGMLPSIDLQLDKGGISILTLPYDVAKEEAATPAPPIPPPELSRNGKPLTRKQKKELKQRTAGSDWFDLPAPSEADLPRLYREVEALRLRNQLDPKRFYRKDEGEGKGIKGLPKYFAIGTIIPSSTPFGTASADNLPKSHRKRTLVDELLDDAGARHHTKKKFKELQVVKETKGKNTRTAKTALRKPKW